MTEGLEGPFEHGDHQAFVGDRPNKEAWDLGFMPSGIMLDGDLIACAECRNCGWKKASSVVPVDPKTHSDSEIKKGRTSMAILLFRTAPTSCEETRLRLLASDVIES